MSTTTFSGPVVSNNGFSSGTSAAPVSTSTAQNLTSFYGTTSATTGDTRLNYSKLTFTGAGAGETIRAFSVVSGAGVATGGTVNGGHVSLSVNTGGTVSGAGNALRLTLGGTSTNPGGTLAALQLDSDFASGGTWSNASFMRVTNSGTGAIGNFIAMPAASSTGVFRTVLGSAVCTHTIPITSGGTTYYIMVSTVA